MKVLIATETLYEGGVELFILRFARALRKKGVKVEVLLLNSRYQRHSITSKFSDLDIISLQLPFQGVVEWIDRILFGLRSDFSFKNSWHQKIIRKKILKGVDIVHTHYIKTDYLFSTCGIKSFRHIVTVHGDYSAQYYHHEKHNRSIWNIMEDKLDVLKRSVDQWVLISDEQVRFFDTIMGVKGDKAVKIYNGFDNTDILRYEKGYIPDVPVTGLSVCMAGRGVKEKGWLLAIDAIKKLPEDCHLFIVGDSNYLQQLKIDNKNEKRIHFLGHNENPVLIMGKCDLLLMPTFLPYESLPNVIVESLSVHTPVIATDVGEIKKMITDENTGKQAGFVIDFNGTRPDETQLYNNLFFLYHNRNVLTDMRQVAKAAFLKFKMDNCVAAYQQLYLNLLS